MLFSNCESHDNFFISQERLLHLRDLEHIAEKIRCMLFSFLKAIVNRGTENVIRVLLKQRSLLCHMK
jgi:hypothetical protein